MPAARQRQGINGDAVEIAVIDLPHISNFTDLDAFRGESDVRLRIVRSPADLRSPTPCSFPAARTRWPTWAISAAAGWPADRPAGPRRAAPRWSASAADSRCWAAKSATRWPWNRPPGTAAGLGLLETVTVMAAEKTLARTTAAMQPRAWRSSATKSTTGRRTLATALPLFRRQATAGWSAAAAPTAASGAPICTGSFDADPFRRWFIDRLRVRRGLTPLGRVIAPYDIEPALDRLADAVRRSLDMKRLR